VQWIQEHMSWPLVLSSLHVPVLTLFLLALGGISPLMVYHMATPCRNRPIDRNILEDKKISQVSRSGSTEFLPLIKSFEE
jgi:hypothetical protein